jgi:hypothetical protein
MMEMKCTTNTVTKSHQTRREMVSMPLTYSGFLDLIKVSIKVFIT